MKRRALVRESNYLPLSANAGHNVQRGKKMLETNKEKHTHARTHTHTHFWAEKKRDNAHAPVFFFVLLLSCSLENLKPSWSRCKTKCYIQSGTSLCQLVQKSYVELRKVGKTNEKRFFYPCWHLLPNCTFQPVRAHIKMEARWLRHRRHGKSTMSRGRRRSFFLKLIYDQSKLKPIHAPCSWLPQTARRQDPCWTWSWSVGLREFCSCGADDESRGSNLFQTLLDFLFQWNVGEN